MRRWRSERRDLIAAGYGCPECNVVAKGTGARAVHVCEHGIATSPALAASRAEDWLAYEADQR